MEQSDESAEQGFSGNEAFGPVDWIQNPNVVGELFLTVLAVLFAVNSVRGEILLYDRYHRFLDLSIGDRDGARVLLVEDVHVSAEILSDDFSGGGEPIIVSTLYFFASSEFGYSAVGFIGERVIVGLQKDFEIHDSQV